MTASQAAAAAASAVSAYAPLRRNSFLQQPADSSLSQKLSTFSLGVTLVLIRCWKDSRIWHDLIGRLPLTWQQPLQALMLQWRGNAAGLIANLTRRLLRGLQAQLIPFARMRQTGTTTDYKSNDNSGDAPTSIMCDLSSTQVTTIWSSDYYEDRVRQNQALIQKVLHYWFGQYEPDIAQKKLWMIAASSSTHQQEVDAEIADLFGHLLCELATASSSSSVAGGEAAAAAMISDVDGTIQPCRWKQWCADKELYGYAGKLAAIIVLDQFSRHIWRHQETQKAQQQQQDGDNNSSNDAASHINNNLSTLPPQPVLDQLALRTAQLFTEGHTLDIRCGMIPIPQYIFGLMPYRHASTLESVTYVQKCVEHGAQLNLQLEGMTSRFRKASNRRMAILQDEARRTGKANNSTTTTIRSNNENDSNDNDAAELATNSTKLTFHEDDILEIFPFDADMSDAQNHPIVRTIQDFLAEQGILPSVDPVVEVGSKGAAITNLRKQQKEKKRKGKRNDKEQSKQQQSQKLPNSAAEFNNNNKKKKNNNNEIAESAPPCSIIISLSGGVDSMVIASALAFLKSKGGFPHMDVVAIHIDYANRPESRAESNFVEKYCKEQGLRFVVRRIDEITRGITARDEYEQQARTVRYDMYRSVAEDCTKKHPQATVGVMLGHHRGDLRENVLSNAHKGCGPLDLSGMTAVSQNDGVTIYRPLLPLEKTAIYDYSHQYGVPYFKDTTPNWSTRGKLRNKLVPLLEEIYGEGSMNNLSTLATESDECRNLLHDALLKPFMNQVVRRPMGISFETAPFVARATGTFFWKFVLREVLHSAGLGMFSDKSVISFLERIRPVHTYKKTIREGWLQCRKDYAVYLQADGKIFVFYPDSLPWRKSDAFKCLDQMVDVNQQNTVAVGPWIVEAEVCNSDPSEKETLLKRKAISSMTQFMDGFVEYYLEVPIERKTKDAKPLYHPIPLLFVSSFRKSNRPPAWKNTDEKLQEILPLLGLSEDACHDLKMDEENVAVVRITLDRRFSSE